MIRSFTFHTGILYKRRLSPEPWRRLRTLYTSADGRMCYLYEICICVSVPHGLFMTILYTVHVCTRIEQPSLCT